jgi:hypothetical protein
MDKRSPNSPAGQAEGGAVFEFEAESRGTIIETWRITLPGCEDLDEEQIADLIEDELASGNAQFVAQVSDEEHDRLIKRDSVLRL